MSEEVEETRLREEQQRFQWCVDQLNNVVYDMVNNKQIEHNMIICALGLVKAEFTANTCVTYSASKPRNV